MTSCTQNDSSHIVAISTFSSPGGSYSLSAKKFTYLMKCLRLLQFSNKHLFTTKQEPGPKNHMVKPETSLIGAS